MELTKTKLLILVWLWSLFCIVLTVSITFGIPFQSGLFERIPNFVVLVLWVVIPLSLIKDAIVVRVAWILALAGGPCMIISLLGTFYLIGSKNWKLIVLYLIFVFSFIPHGVIVFFMRKEIKLSQQLTRKEEEERRQEEEEERREHDRMEARLANEMRQLMDRQDLERGIRGKARVDNRARHEKR